MQININVCKIVEMNGCSSTINMHLILCDYTSKETMNNVYFGNSALLIQV